MNLAFMGVLMDRGKRTFAERLGWEAGRVVVMVHVDDAGMSHASNQGAMEAMEGGVATSLSVMMPCAGVPEMVELLKLRPRTDAGVHLTLTSGTGSFRWAPVAGALRVPGLVDGGGCFRELVGEVVKHASPDEVELEMRAQLAMAERLGLLVTHLDTHMGVVFSHPGFFERYVKLGVEKRLPLLVAGGHATHAMEANGEAVRQLAPYAERIWAAGLPVLDDIHATSLDWEPGEKKQRFMQLLRGLKPGVTEIITHAARAREEELDLACWTRASRLADLETLLDPEVKAVVEECGILLTTWRELAERRAGVGG